MEYKDFNWLLVLPYIAVFILAFSRLHVLAVLTIGVLLSGLFGLFATAEFDLLKLNTSIYDGFVGMFEVALLSMFLGGL